MLKLCFDLAHSMFNDGYSPSTRHGEETFGHRADDTSFCFVVYPGVIFCVQRFLLHEIGRRRVGKECDR